MYCVNENKDAKAHLAFFFNFSVCHSYICSAQSRNRYNSRMALRKVRTPTWLRNSRMVSDHSRIAQGIFSVLSIR